MKRFILIFAGIFVFIQKPEAFAWINPQGVFVPPSVNVSSSPVSATAGTVTVSTPLAGPFSAGTYNYITNIHLEMYASQTQIGAGGIASVACTSTNLPGNPQWFFPVVVTSGTVTITDVQYANPLQATQGDQVTITCPAKNGATWNMNVGYYQAQ